MPVERPDSVEEVHLVFLDELRDSAETNMFGAGPYLQEEFGLTRPQSSEILMYWMESFSERSPN